MKKSSYIAVLPAVAHDFGAFTAADTLARLKANIGIDTTLEVWANEKPEFVLPENYRMSGSDDRAGITNALVDRLRERDQVQELEGNCWLRIDNYNRTRAAAALVPASLAELSGQIQAAGPDKDLLLARKLEGGVLALQNDFVVLADLLMACGFQSDEGRFGRLWFNSVLYVDREWVLSILPGWELILSALELPLPRLVCIGPIRFIESQGQPLEVGTLLRNYGTDGLRLYYLLNKPTSVPQTVTEEQLANRINQYLANNLGNLVTRVVSLLVKYTDGIIPRSDLLTRQTPDLELREVALAAVRGVESAVDKFDMPQAVGHVWRLIAQVNKFIEETSPWQLAAEQNAARLHTVLYSLGEAIRFTGVLLKPLLPEAATKIISQLGLDTNWELQTWSSICQWGGAPVGQRVVETPPLFPRISLHHSTAEPVLELITQEDFARMHMTVVRVVSAHKIGLDRLVLVVYDGRRRLKVIVPAGRYSPQELEGRKLVVVSNLATQEFEGVRGEGEAMQVLTEDGMSVFIFIDDDVPEGGRIYAGLV